GTCPGPSRYSYVPDAAAIQKRLAHSAKGVSRSARLTGGAGRPGEGSFALPGRGLAGGGGAPGGPPAKPGTPRDSVTLSPSVPRPTGGPRPLLRPPRSKYTEAAGVPSKRLDTWAVPDPSGGVVAPWLVGVVVGVSPSRFPFGVGSPAAPWLSASGIGRY